MAAKPARSCDALVAGSSGGALAASPRGETPREQTATGASQLRCIIASANGTFIDRAEATALAAHFPNVPVLTLKKSFGECPGAGALMQTIAAALNGGRTLATVVGFNQQCGAALVSG